MIIIIQNPTRARLSLTAGKLSNQPCPKVFRAGLNITNSLSPRLRTVAFRPVQLRVDFSSWADFIGNCLPRVQLDFNGHFRQSIIRIPLHYIFGA
jgi:hypothetical protein